MLYKLDNDKTQFLLDLVGRHVAPHLVDACKIGIGNTLNLVHRNALAFQLPPTHL